MTGKSKFTFFSLKPPPEVGSSDQTAELPSTRSPSEIHTAWRQMFSDANCIPLGLPCHLHTPAPRGWCWGHSCHGSLAPAAQSRPQSSDTDRDIPFKVWLPGPRAVVPKSQLPLFLYKLWSRYHITLVNQMSAQSKPRLRFSALVSRLSFEVRRPRRVIASLAPPLGYFMSHFQNQVPISPLTLIPTVNDTTTMPIISPQNSRDKKLFSSPNLAGEVRVTRFSSQSYKRSDRARIWTHTGFTQTPFC